MSHTRTANIDSAALDAFCSKHNRSLTNALAATWAVTFHTYTFSNIARLSIRSLRSDIVKRYELEVQSSTTFLQLLKQHGGRRGSADTIPVIVFPIPTPSSSGSLTQTAQSAEFQINDRNLDQITITIEPSLSPIMVKTFEIALSALCQFPTEPIRKVNLCSEFDLYMNRQCTRNTASRQTTTITMMIRMQACAQPHATAIEAHDGIMTYAQLEQTTSNLARYLVNKGVPPHACILLYFRRGLWAYVSMLAVMKARCHYAAVDAIFPVEHVVETVRAADIKVVLTDEIHPAELSNAYEMVIPISESLLSSLQDVKDPPRWSKTEDLCFLIFTSGSSGKRKAIRQQHVSFCTALNDFGAKLDIGPHTRVLCSEDLSFMISNAEIFSALAFGAVACVPSDKTLSAGYEKAINQFRATLFLNSPTSLSLLNPKSVPSLRTVCSLGEPLSKEVIARWSSPRIRLGNIYGMSECSIWVGFTDRITPKTPTPTPIGRVAAGAIYLTHPDNSDILVPVDAIGNIVFEGPIAAGYLDTTSPFQADFLDPTPRWLETLHGRTRCGLNKIYRSGDLGRCKADGTIEYLGRRNRTLKLDGNFVNVEDVEALVRPCVGKGDLVVVEVLEGEGGRRSACFAVFLQTSTRVGEGEGCVGMEDCEDEETLGKLEKIREKMGEIPWILNVEREFYVVGRMPRTPSGKVDRKVLRGLVEEGKVGGGGRREVNGKAGDSRGAKGMGGGKRKVSAML